MVAKKKSGTADSMERKAEEAARRATGKGQGYDKISSPAEMAAYRFTQGKGPKRSPISRKK